MSNPDERAGTSRVLDLTIVSDAICPWCYVGKRRLETALARIGPALRVRVTWRAFQLNPHMPKDGMERRAYRSSKFGWEKSQQLDAEIAVVGAQEGLTFRHDLMARTPNTFDAHRLIWLADREGRQDAVVEALFRAYFTEGRDIGDRAVLVELAVEAGIDPARARAFIDGDEAAAEVARDEAAAHRQGISGVPSFLVDGRELFSGAQRPELMAQRLRAAAEAHARA